MTTGFTHLSSPVDSVFLIIVGISLVLLVLITASMVYFVIRYNRKRNPMPEHIEGNPLLEIIWTVIPTIIVLAIFYYGWVGFKRMRTVPEDAMTISVTGRMWSWAFTYGNGMQSDVLRVPLKKPVKLTITSDDVLHSLYIPAFRVKEDAVPRMNTFLWFLPDEIGSFDIYCSEYCGVGHHSMITKVVVMTDEEFDRWYASGQKKGPEDAAITILEGKGCLGCHTTDGSPKIGPTFKGLFGSREIVVTAGKEREVVVDESYLRRAILEPGEDVRKGYPPIMPSQKELVTEDEIGVIIQYLKEIR